MKRDLPRELDYHKEAANCRRCEKNFAHDSRVKVPKVYDKYTRERVLTMSYEVGTPVTHVKKMREQGIDLKELSQLISEVFNHMIFKAGFVHSDPHPGNLFVRKTPNGKLEIVLLDHGIYQELKEETRLSYAGLWRGILQQDEAMIKEHSELIGADFY